MVDETPFAPGPPPSAPAYAIVTPRLRLAPASPEQALAVKEAADASLPELQKWMPWSVGMPQAVEQHVATLRGFRASFERDEEYLYMVTDRADGSLAGGCGLRRSQGPLALEIGYWIRTDRTGRGYASEQASALTRAGFDLHGVRRMEIRVAVGNARSSAVARRLGYTLEATLRERIAVPGDRLSDVEVWTMLREEFSSSAAAKVPIEAFDALGRRML